MPRTIRPDGSLDPLADFEDDGASFRVRREAELRAKYAPPASVAPVDKWSWRYIFEASTPDRLVRLFLKIIGYTLLFFIGAVGMIALLAAFNVIH